MNIVTVTSNDLNLHYMAPDEPDEGPIVVNSVDLHETDQNILPEMMEEGIVTPPEEDEAVVLMESSAEATEDPLALGDHDDDLKAESEEESENSTMDVESIFKYIGWTKGDAGGPRKYKIFCTLCKSGVSSQSHHLAFHRKEGRFQCQYCNHVPFSTETGLRRHLMSQHLTHFLLQVKKPGISKTEFKELVEQVMSGVETLVQNKTMDNTSSHKINCCPFCDKKWDNPSSFNKPSFRSHIVRKHREILVSQLENLQ